MGLQFHDLPVDVFPPETRPSLQRLNSELRDLFSLEAILLDFRDLPHRSDKSIIRGKRPQVSSTRVIDVTGFNPFDVPFVTIGNTDQLTQERALAVDSPITLVDAGANSTVTIGLDIPTLNGLLSHDPLLDKDLGDQHLRYVYLFPLTDTRNVIDPLTAGTIAGQSPTKMTQQNLGFVGMGGALWQTGEMALGTGDGILFKTANGNGRIAASRSADTLVIGINRVLTNAQGGTQVTSRGSVEMMFWSTADFDKGRETIRCRQWVPTGGNGTFFTTMSAYQGHDKRGSWYFGGGMAVGGGTSEKGPINDQDDSLARVAIFSTWEGSQDDADVMDGLYIDSASGHTDNPRDAAIPLWAALGDKTVITSTAAPPISAGGRRWWVTAEKESPWIGARVQHAAISEDQQAKSMEHNGDPLPWNGLGNGAPRMELGHRLMPWYFIGNVTSAPTNCWGRWLPTVKGWDNYLDPNTFVVQTRHYLWIHTPQGTDSDHKCEGGIRLDNHYIFGVDTTDNDLLKLWSIRSASTAVDGGGIMSASGPNAEQAKISWGSIDSTGSDAIYVRQDGTSPGAVTQRQSFTNGITTPTGIGGGIILNEGTDTVQLYESAGAALLKIDASNSFTWSVGGGVPYQSLPATGVIAWGTTTMDIDSLDFTPSTAGTYTIDVKDALLLKSDETTSAGSRPVLWVQAPNASAPRTVFQAGTVGTSYLSVIANTAATSGVNVFKSSNGTMDTTSSVGWTFNTGGAVIGTVYDFQNNSGSMLKLASTGATVGTNLYLPLDSRKIIFGTGNDAEIYYDAVDLVIDPRVVLSTGSVKIPGNIPLHLPGTNVAVTDTAYVDFGNAATVISSIIFRGIAGAISNFAVEAPTGEKLSLNVSVTSAAFNSGSVDLTFSSTGGNITFDTTGTAKTFIFNALKGDHDFIVKADNNDALLYGDAGSDAGVGRVGVNTAAPAATFDVAGNARGTQIIADGDTGGTASTNTITGATDTPTTDPGWATSDTVAMNAPDGYVKAYVGTQAVVIPYWVT